MIPETKDSRRVRAAKIGARARWGPQRTVRLADCDPVTREVILRILAAAEHARHDAEEAARAV
jgi:hypothetical protein